MCEFVSRKGPGKQWHIVANTLLTTQMFPCLPARATFVADTNFVSGTQKCFWFCSETFCVLNKCFPVQRSPRNIMGNNVSATMCLRLPGPFKEMLINTCVEMPIGFTNITSFTARTWKLINNMWFKRIRNKVLRTKHSAKFEWREKNLHLSLWNTYFYYMVSSTSGQDDPNRTMWLATRARKMEPSCLLGTICCIPQEKCPRKLRATKSLIDQVCSVKMAGYWPRSFYASLWTSTSSRSINTQKTNLANSQPSWPHTWSIKRGTWGALEHRNTA